MLPIGGELGAVPASLWCKQACLPTIETHRSNDTVYRRELRGGIDQRLPSVSKAEEVRHFPRSTGDLPEELSIDIVAIEVGVPIAARLPDELTITPRDEAHRPLRLDILVVMLREERLDVVTRGRVIGLEIHMVLLAIDLSDVDGLAIGCPRDIRQILLLGFARLEVSRLPRSHVIDP